LGVLLLTGCAPLPQTVRVVAFARLNKALDFYMAGHYDLALSEAGAAMRLTPDPLLVAYALNVRAAAYLKMGKYEQALEATNAPI
jgi:tetratricopeptide (TPR) repeat protein